jgi:protein TonB
MAGTPIPDDLRVILDKSFNLDASMRYPSMIEMKQAISAAAHGGKYTATTFNLAFYLTTLLKKELETEAVERAAEAKVNAAAYAEALRPVTVSSAPTPVITTPAMEASAPAEEPKRRLLVPIAVAATLLLAAGAGAWVMLGRRETPAAAGVATAQAVPMGSPASTQAPLFPEPIVASPTPAVTETAATATTGSAAAAETPEEAKKRAFEEAVKRKLQEEMMKLQQAYMDELKQKQSRNAPVANAPAPAPQTAATTATAAEEKPAVSAADLDRQRLQTREEEPARTATAAPANPQPVQTVASTQTAAPAPAQAAPPVRQGDVVDVTALDTLPRVVRSVRPTYPPMAARQKVSATIFVTMLIDENGDVADVKVLRGDERFGLNDAAVRAMRATRFSPPMKNGQRVKTWMPQTIEFKP